MDDIATIHLLKECGIFRVINDPTDLRNFGEAMPLMDLSLGIKAGWIEAKAARWDDVLHIASISDFIGYFPLLYALRNYDNALPEPSERTTALVDQFMGMYIARFVTVDYKIATIWFNDIQSADVRIITTLSGPVYIASIQKLSLFNCMLGEKDIYSLYPERPGMCMGYNTKEWYEARAGRKC